MSPLFAAPVCRRWFLARLLAKPDVRAAYKALDGVLGIAARSVAGKRKTFAVVRDAAQICRCLNAAA